jgi:hypothetical protein
MVVFTGFPHDLQVFWAEAIKGASDFGRFAPHRHVSHSAFTISSQLGQRITRVPQPSHRSLPASIRSSQTGHWGKFWRFLNSIGRTL